MPDEPIRVLILGGTGEARELARSLSSDPRYFPVTSLAGLTREPEMIAGETRTGGFGGVKGLAQFIAEQDIDVVVDGAHPFAAQISTNAVEACASSGVPCLRLERPRWEAQGGDEWTVVDDVGAAAFAIPPEAHAFVTVGRQEIGTFFSRDDISLLARMIERPNVTIPGNAEIMLARPPFTVEQEKTLMLARGISLLVTKNAGGEATYAKVEAARRLNLPVIMIARPKKPPALTVSSSEEMLSLIGETIG